jgi:hypothetical protein
MARPTLALVSVQKPTANTPVLQRRNKFTSSIEQQIIKVGLFREGKRISREQFWVDGSGAIFFQLRYGNSPSSLRRESPHSRRRHSMTLSSSLTSSRPLPWRAASMTHWLRVQIPSGRISRRLRTKRPIEADHAVQSARGVVSVKP